METLKAVKIIDEIDGLEKDAVEITTTTTHTILKESLERQKAVIDEKLAVFK